MANRNNHALINATSTWTLSDFPEYIRNPSIIEIQTDPGNENPWNGDKIAMLNGSITKAILEYAKGKKSSIALVQVGVGSYASEMELKDGRSLRRQDLRNIPKCRRWVRLHRFLRFQRLNCQRFKRIFTA